MPMVEPEVLMDGEHDIDVCYEVTEAVLRSLFSALYDQNVMLEGTILKASMVVSGKDCPEQASVDEVAELTAASAARFTKPYRIGRNRSSSHCESCVR